MVLSMHLGKHEMQTRNAHAAICFELFVCVAGLAQNQGNPHQLPSEANKTQLIESVEAAALFKAYCATCQRPDGKGMAPMAEWPKVKTPDLTQISLRLGGKFPLDRVQRIISGQENIKFGHGPDVRL
jgi:hypothetical protein